MPIAWPEPFGLVMIEALATGTPVIAFDRGAASEIVVDGENGFLVPVEDPRTIVQKVDLLLRSPELRARFQRRGFQTAERFNWERSIDTLERSLFPLVKSYSPSCC